MNANAEFTVLSAEPPRARVASGIGGKAQLVVEEVAALPARSLGLGPFTVEPAESGLPQLVDSSGQRWGIFANQRLAEETAASLSR